MKALKLLTHALMFSAVFSAAQAHAEVYECSRSENEKYLLALNDDSGIVFSNEQGHYSAREGEVRVIRAMDGGPVSVFLKPTIDVDFEGADSARCFKTGQSQLNFSIQVSTRGDMGSSLQHLMNIVVNPRVRCPMPQPGLAPLLPLNCELL